MRFDFFLGYITYVCSVFGSFHHMCTTNAHTLLGTIGWSFDIRWVTYVLDCRSFSTQTIVVFAFKLVFGKGNCIFKIKEYNFFFLITQVGRIHPTLLILFGILSDEQFWSSIVKNKYCVKKFPQDSRMKEEDSFVFYENKYYLEALSNLVLSEEAILNLNIFTLKKE